MIKLNKYKSGFALPTLIIVGTILMIAAVSSLAASSSIGKNLRDQQWNSVADNAANAGVAFAKSCIKEKKTDYWDNKTLTPATDCNGDSISGLDSSLAIMGNKVVTFVVKAVENGKALVEGRVEAASGQTWVSNKVVIVNVESSAPLKAQKVSTDTATTCVLASNARVYCAGNNSKGQLGIGNTTNQNSPQKFAIPGDKAVKDIEVGNQTVCALTVDSQMWCSGWNDKGQLGVGDTTDRQSPVRFNPGGHPVISMHLKTNNALLATTTNICAHVTNGTANQSSSGTAVYCAGYNQSGEFGIGNKNNQHSPVAVLGTGSGGRGAKSGVLAQGTTHMCIVAFVGMVFQNTYCAGQNDSKQITNTTTAEYTSPVAPSIPSAFNAPLDIQAGLQYTCVLGTTPYVSPIAGFGHKKAYCFGNNGDGQNNIGYEENFLVQKLDVDMLRTCILIAGGRVYCAGNNGYGQLGGSTGTVTSGKAFGGDNEIISSDVKQDSESVCVLKSADSSMWCAGKNDKGQLGIGTAGGNQALPVKFGSSLPNFDAVKEIYTGKHGLTGRAKCALTVQGEVYCAGDNTYGQLGNKSNTNSSVPVKFQLPSE